MKTRTLIWLIALSFLCTKTNSAQTTASASDGPVSDIEVPKFRKYLDKGKYEHCIDLARARTQNDPKDPVPHAYAALAWAAKARIAQKERQAFQAGNYLKKAFGEVYVLKKLDHDGKVERHFDPELGEMIALGQELCKALVGDDRETQAKELVNDLATVFEDSSELYFDFYPATAVVVAKIPEPAPEKVPAPQRNEIIQFAEKFIGTKYVYGGAAPGGFDCSGYTKYVFRNEGINIPHQSHAQSKVGKQIPLREAQPGDLIFFGSKNANGYRTQHAGIIHSNEEGNLRVIHCPNSGVKIEGDGEPGWDSYWVPRILFVKRVLED